MQRKKRNKGFTLIELIIVVAILAILAMIAIPRFAGFTNRAKIAADEQMAVLVSNTAKILLASGDIAVGSENNVITLSQTSPYISIGEGITKPSSSKNPALDVVTMFTNTIEIKSLQYYTSIAITVNSDGSTSITTTP